MPDTVVSGPMPMPKTPLFLGAEYEAAKATAGLCPKGIVSGPCVTAGHYKITGHESDFYTTWSLYMCLIAAGLTVLYLVIYGVYGAPSSPARGLLNSLAPGRSGWVKFMQIFTPYILVPIIVFAALNSIGVLATSQQFLGWNFMQSIAVPAPKAPNLNGIELTFADYIFKDNFFVHIMPALLAVVILFLLSIGKFGPRVNAWGVVGGVFAALVSFVGLYLLVPASNKSMGLKKVNFVYNNPAWYLFATQLGLVTLGSFVVPLFMLSDKWRLNLTGPATA
jgi:hypothetical protein